MHRDEIKWKKPGGDKCAEHAGATPVHASSIGRRQGDVNRETSMRDAANGCRQGDTEAAAEFCLDEATVGLCKVHVSCACLRCRLREGCKS